MNRLTPKAGRVNGQTWKTVSTLSGLSAVVEVEHREDCHRRFLERELGLIINVCQGHGKGGAPPFTSLHTGL